MLATDKQLFWIANEMIFKAEEGHKKFEEIVEKYESGSSFLTVGNIKTEVLNGLTFDQADYIIKAWKKEKCYKFLTATNIIINNRKEK